MNIYQYIYIWICEFYNVCDSMCVLFVLKSECVPLCICICVCVCKKLWLWLLGLCEWVNIFEHLTKCRNEDFCVGGCMWYIWLCFCMCRYVFIFICFCLCVYVFMYEGLCVCFCKIFWFRQTMLSLYI